jgi:beta-glucosidase
VIGNGMCFPVSMARGATWDPALEEAVGDAIGKELRASGANLTGAVCINLLRHPAWGRAQETYGEDPHHVGELGAAFTRGLQRNVMACVKHFACNSMENARFTVDVEADDLALHEVYLAQFRRVVGEGVASVMTAYNSLNGEWCGQNRDLLASILRGEWGFEGFVISDWIFGLRDAAPSLAAGLDVEMPYRMVRAQHLRDALDGGEASWGDVDASVTRLVATLLRFDEVLSAPPPGRDVIGCDEHRALARSVAARTTLLLRNEIVDGTPVLPLRADDLPAAVIGRLADTVNLGDGGSSDVWALECTTVLAGLREALPHVVYDPGDDLETAARAAESASTAVVVVGYTRLDEGEYIGGNNPDLAKMFPPQDEPEVVARFEAEIADLPATTRPDRLRKDDAGGLAFSIGGDRESLRLKESDVALIHAVAAANPRTAVVIQAGSAVIMSEWVDEVGAVVQAWYGGSEAGSGLADVLTGAVNPSARLPFTVPADESDLPAFDRDATRVTYDRWHGWWRAERIGAVPEFPFGFGLSYTTFEIAPATATPDRDAITITGEVRNTGPRAGAEVVQAYVTMPDTEAPRRLAGFTRVEVPAGGAEPFTIEIPLSRLTTRDPEHHGWLDPSGSYRFSIGRFAGDPSSHHLTVSVTPGPRPD